MYFADMELCTYHSGPFDAGNWSVPLRAVGWLESPHLFLTGVASHALVSKLTELAIKTGSRYPHEKFRGLHVCSFCREKGPATSLTGSHINVFIPGDDVVYIAPAGIVHYIETHSYAPPPEFVAAVLRCPDPSTDDYSQMLRNSNRGKDPPLKVTPECVTSIQTRRAKRAQD